MKILFLFVIRMYRALISPILGSNCRFHPSCSAYAEEAVTKKGGVSGAAASFIRLAKCHPFHPGGFDPVE